jgi:PAS domain S-box-containing protein
MHLEPFDVGRLRVQDALRTLCTLTRDSVRQQEYCDVLAPLIASKVERSQRNVDLRGSAGFEAARQAVAEGEGKALMDQIRVVIARMDAEEQARLGERSLVAAREASVAGRLATAAEGMGIILLVTMFILLIRESRMRQRMQGQLDRFFTLSLDMLCIAGMDGYFKRLSPAFHRTLGYTTEELLARPFLDFVHPDDRAATLSEVERLHRGIPTISFENRYQCRDGSWRWLSWKSQPVAEEGLLYASARDITERKEAEERIAQLNADLQVGANHLREVNRELETFSYSVSHDLRAPLRSIDGFSQVLLEDYADRLDGEGRDALQRVRRAAATMGELIDALLALSRINRVQLRSEPVDLSALAETIAAELRQTQPDRQAEFVIAPGLVVDGDPTLLRAMLGNLLGNAWKYTEPRGTARIEFGSREGSGERVYFVSDNGVGFDMAYVGKLFGAFQRLHRQGEFGGTGIGLATVQRIVHRHCGRIWAEGAVDQGASFSFTLGGQAADSGSGLERTDVPIAAA